MTDQIPKPSIDKQAFLKSANEVRVILESEGKIPVQPAEEQLDRLIIEWRSENGDLFLSHNEQIMLRNEIMHLITQEKRKLLDEVVAKKKHLIFSDGIRREAVPLSVIEELRRKV